MRTFWRLLGFLRPYRGGVRTSFALAAAAMGMGVLVPYLVGRTVDEIRELFGPHAYGDLDTSLGSAILRQCARIGCSLSVVEAGSAGRITNLLAEENEMQDWFRGGQVVTWRNALELLDATGDGTVEPIHVVRSLVNDRASANERHATLGLAICMDEALDNERRVGRMAFVLNISGEEFERTHRVEANPGEIRRRAALWASEFLHVTLAQRVTAIT
jgi:nicotinamide mononucleotide (NMN) deamidase PncC